MRLFPPLLLAACASASASASAPPGMTIAGLVLDTPVCARSCVVDSLITERRCPVIQTADDLADCLCTDVGRLSGMSACAVKSCSHADMITAKVLEGKLCAAYPHESRARQIQTMAIVTIVLAVTVTAARCLCRYRERKYLALDDWMSVAAMVFLLGMAINAIFLGLMGGGRHHWDIDPRNETPLWMTFWTAQHFYILTQYFAKLAVLGLYLRIFGCTPWLRRACHWCGAILTASSLGFLLYLILQCRPVAAAWDKALPGGRCQSSDAAAFALATLSIAFDVVLVVLPVPALHRLQLHCRQRLAAAALLGLASLACVTSVLRLRYVMALNATFDPSWDNAPIGIWSLIEQLCVVVCGSLPALYHAFSSRLPYCHANRKGTRGHGEARGSSGSPFHERGGLVHEAPGPPLPCRASHQRSPLGSFYGIALAPPHHPFYPPSALWESLDDGKTGKLEKDTVMILHGAPPGSSDGGSGGQAGQLRPDPRREFQPSCSSASSELDLEGDGASNVSFPRTHHSEK